MALRIFNNVTSLNAQRSLDSHNARLRDIFERIATGVRINRASVDIASFSVSLGLRSDARVLRQAEKNANDGIALINAAESGLNTISSILIRLRELAFQSATGTLGDTQRRTVQLEFTSLKAEVDRIALTSEFNGQKLLDGALSSNASTQVVLAVGLNSSVDNLINLNEKVDLAAVTTAGLQIAEVSVSTQAEALDALKALEDGITTLLTTRGRLGAVQNATLRTASVLNTTIVNIIQADSALSDADLSEEFAELTKNQILLQASSAMIGQANLIPRAVLQLLR